MKKKSSRIDKHKSAAPQAAQMDAVRKLFRSGRYGDANARLAEMRASFPDFKPLLAKAKEHGKETIVVGLEPDFSTALRNTADVVIDLRE